MVCALADAHGEVIDKIVVPTGDPAPTFAAICEFFRRAVGSDCALEGVGVASFGPVEIDPQSTDYGAIKKTPKLGWEGVNYREELAEFNTPVNIDTDVNGAALGEWIYGAGKGLTTVAYVTVGTGIGVGVLREGNSLAGFSHYEMGHIRPPQDKNKDPFPGICPFHGNCLEGLASGPAIIARWGASLSEITDPARQAAAIDLEAEYLSNLALTIIMAHMPDCIIFGGGVMKAPGLFGVLREKTVSLLGDYLAADWVSGDLSSYIVPPKLNDNAGITGALALARLNRV